MSFIFLKSTRCLVETSVTERIDPRFPGDVPSGWQVEEFSGLNPESDPRNGHVYVKLGFNCNRYSDFHHPEMVQIADTDDYLSMSSLVHWGSFKIGVFASFCFDDDCPSGEFSICPCCSQKVVDLQCCPSPFIFKDGFSYRIDYRILSHCPCLDASHKPQRLTLSFSTLTFINVCAVAWDF